MATKKPAGEVRAKRRVARKDAPLRQLHPKTRLGRSPTGNRGTDAARKVLLAAFAKRSLSAATDALKVSRSEIAHMLGVHAKSLLRWEQGAAIAPKHRNHLELLNQLVFLLDTGFRGPAEGLTWFHDCSVPAFHGRTPLFMAVSGALQDVVGLLMAAEAGSHA